MRPLSFIAFAFAAACGSRASTVPSAAATERTLAAQIAAVSAAMPRLTGTITMKPTDEDTYSVSFALRGARENGQLEWAIRPGRCGLTVPVPDSDVAGREAYRPIRVQGDGEVHDNVKFRVRLPDDVLHVDLMNDAGRRVSVVACGLLIER